MKTLFRFAILLSVVSSVSIRAMAAGKMTVVTTIQPPPNYNRVKVTPGTFAASLRDLELVNQPELLAGDGKTILCKEDKVAVTAITPFDNKHDTGVDGIVKLWGEYLWNSKHGTGISFPLDNGQIALWKDWRDGLRPKEKGGKFIFTQVTTPSGGYPEYMRYLSFVGEAMGALALRRESTIVLDDSLTVGDLIVAVKRDEENSVGLIIDACKGPRGEKLFLLGTCGAPSTTLYVMKPYSPVQGLNEWYSLEGARWAIGQGVRTDLRRVTLSK